VFTLQFEHAITDFDAWRTAFDRDPIDRVKLGVRRHRIHRPVGDSHYVLGELDFDTLAQAEACRDALLELWGSRAAAPALTGAPRVRILSTIEDREYGTG
jgi:hypothetical protein